MNPAEAYRNLTRAQAERLAMLDRINSIRADTGSLRGLRGKAYNAAAARVGADAEARRAPLRVQLDALTVALDNARKALRDAKASVTP